MKSPAAYGGDTKPRISERSSSRPLNVTSPFACPQSAGAIVQTDESTANSPSSLSAHGFAAAAAAAHAATAKTNPFIPLVPFSSRLSPV
mgnify:CR=1 FL=1